jgi:hypothetical protein
MHLKQRQFFLSTTGLTLASSATGQKTTTSTPESSVVPRSSRKTLFGANSMGWIDPSGKQLSFSPNQLKSLLTHTNLNAKVASKARYEDSLGISTDTLKSSLVKVTQVVTEFDKDYRKGMSVKELADSIVISIDSKVIKSYLSKELGVNVNENLRMLLINVGFIDYFRAHMLFDDAISRNNALLSDPSRQNLGVLWSFNQDQLLGVCGYYSGDACQMARLAGFTNMYKIDGFLRGGTNTLLPKSDSESSWHSYVGIILKDGTIFYSDISNSRISLNTARERKGNILSPYSIPTEDWELGFFAYTHFGKSLVPMQKNPNGIWTAGSHIYQSDALSKLKLTPWCALQNPALTGIIDYFERDLRTATIDTGR